MRVKPKQALDAVSRVPPLLAGPVSSVSARGVDDPAGLFLKALQKIDRTRNIYCHRRLFEGESVRRNSEPAIDATSFEKRPRKRNALDAISLQFQSHKLLSLGVRIAPLWCVLSGHRLENHDG